MMKLKLETGFIFKDNVEIQDVLTVDETLLEGFGTRKGLYVYDYMRSEDFFKRIKQACLKGFITKFERGATDTTFRLGYLEKEEEFLTSQEVELDLSDVNDEFKREFLKLLDWYDKHKREINKRCLNNLDNYGNPTDKLKICYDFLVRKSEEDDCEPLSIEDMYHLHDYYDLLGDMIKYKPSTIDYLLFFPYISSIILFFVGIYFMKSINCIFGGAISLACVGAFIDMIHIHISSQRRLNKLAADNFLNELDVDYDCDEEIDFSKKPIKKRELGLVDFINFDLRDCPFADSNALNELAKNYSQDKEQECFGHDSEVSRYSYLMRLIDVELAMLQNNSRTGFQKGAPFITGNDAKKRLMYLGLTPKQIEEDKFINGVLTAIETINRTAYETCEMETLRLLKIAVQYVGLEGASEKTVERLTILCDAIVEKSVVKREMERRVEYDRILEERQNAVQTVEPATKNKILLPKDTTIHKA